VKSGGKSADHADEEGGVHKAPIGGEGRDDAEDGGRAEEEGEALDEEVDADARDGVDERLGAVQGVSIQNSIITFETRTGVCSR
jgi:hypothetical protein